MNSRKQTAFNISKDGKFRITRRITIRVEIRDLFYALAGHPTNKSRRSILANATNLFCPMDGYYGGITYCIGEDLTKCADIITEQFPEIPKELIYEEAEKIKKELKNNY